MSADDELKSFLERASLYQKEIIEEGAGLVMGSLHDRIKVPEKIFSFCGKCDHSTNWEFKEGAHRTLALIWVALYRCANCKDSEVRFFLLAFEQKDRKLVVMKVGQHPPQEIQPANELRKALGDNLPLYVKGMTCRHHSFGIGAYAYFRRLIEETTDNMLDLLADTMRDLGEDPAVIKKVEDAKGLQGYVDKINVASDVFPEHLQPGQQNPFRLLHKLLSVGIHQHSDEKCLDVVDDIRDILEFVFKELKTHVTERKAYADRLKTIAKKLSEKPAKDLI